MPYREIIAVCSQTHTKYINTLRGQNVGYLRVTVTVIATHIKYCHQTMFRTRRICHVPYTLFI